MEKLLYPYLKIEKKKFEVINYRRKMVVYDVPLIYETKSHGNYDLILLTNCSPEVQKKRVLDRDKLSNSLYKRIIGSQLSFEEKRKFNPKIVNTNSSKLIVFIKVFLLIIKISIRLRTDKWKNRES